MLKILPGLFEAMLVAALAVTLSPLTGLPDVMLGLAIGALVGNCLPPEMRKASLPGLQLFTKKVLKVAIVLLGLKLTADNARDIAQPAVLSLIAACLVVSVALGVLLGRRFGVGRRVALLLGCGTAICGATAVVTIAPLIDAEDDEVAFSVATIFLFNVVALFAFPYMGHALGMSDLAFAAWTGTAVNDTSAVVATGKAFSETAGVYATAIKLIRTLALVPMAVGVGMLWRRAGAGTGDGERKSVSIAEVFPWFVLGFAAVALAANLLPLPREATAGLLKGAGWAVVGVLSAVGLNLDARKLVGAGTRSLALGFALAVVMAAVSFALIRALRIG